MPIFLLLSMKSSAIKQIALDWAIASTISTSSQDQQGFFSCFLLASKRRSIECVKRKEERENKKSMLQYFASLFLQQHRTKQFITFVFLLQCSTVTPLCCAVFFPIPGNGENCSCAFLKKAFEAINCLVSFVDVHIIYSHLQ